MRPEAPTWRGVHRVAHLWLPTPDRARALALWRPGAVLRELAGGWLLGLPAPERVDARACGALPIVSVEGRHTSAPLPRRVLLGHPAGTVILWWGGRERAAALEGLRRVDVSGWVAVPQPVASGLRPLGRPPERVSPPAARPLDLRALAGLGGGSALAEALATVAPGGGWLDPLRSLFARGVGGLARAGAGLAEASPAAASLLSRLESWAEAVGLHGALAALVGAHNARFLQDLLDRLEGGDWAEALARAMPLGGDGVAGPGGLAWLSALKGLQFRGRGGAGAGVGAPSSLYERLRRLYERAFEALRAEGRVREAAYVKAELLSDVAGAVAYLEEVREWALAAEIAEAKGLDPGLVAMLWLRAGEVDRALGYAVARGALGAAVEHLERRGATAEAEALRLTWARREQRAGRSVAAVGIAWPVEGARGEAAGWLDGAVRAGGPGAAAALARSLVLRPERFDDDLTAARELLVRESAPVRRRLATALAAEAGARPKRVLREVARALLRDAWTVGRPEDVEAAKSAVAQVGDGALGADLPPLGARSPARAWPKEVVDWPVTPGDAGATAIFDAIPLPRRRWLVACGELGAWLVDADGRRLRTFAAPAHRVVAAPAGGRALLVGAPLPGGRPRWRVARLDLRSREVEPWGLVPAEVFAEDFDGSVWFVAERDRLIALDALAPGLRSVWEVDRLGPIRDLRWSPAELRVVAAPARALERLRYELPSLALRQRETADPLTGRYPAVVATPDGVLVQSERGVEHATLRPPLVSTRGPASGIAAGRGAVPILVVEGDGLVGAVPDGLATRDRLRLGLGRGARARTLVGPDGDELVVGVDAEGRLRAVDLADGRLIADLRL